VRAGRPDRTIGGQTRNHGPADAVPPIDPDDSQRKHRVDDERLADYLAGELSPDEQAAVEAQLAGDAALRRRLARMREADEALASLSSPAPRDGFEQRLQAALQPELERATATSTQGEQATGDELAARRARRGRGVPSWPVALGGAAAAVALLAIVGIGVSQLVTGDDHAEVALDAEEAPESFEADGAPEDGPVLLASDRDLGDEELEALFDDPRLAGLADRGLAPDEGARLAEAFRAHFADDETMRMSATASADTPRAETMDDADVEADRETDVDDAAAPAADLDADARADMRRCLATLLEEGDDMVPAYAEAATFQGEEVILFGLIAPGADGQRYERIELWVLERDDCQVRTFQPRDR
jgi:anti-sigma-K factor RskA